MITEVCSNPEFLPEPQKNCQKQKPPGKRDAETIFSLSYDMEGHAKKCVE